MHALQFLRERFADWCVCRVSGWALAFGLLAVAPRVGQTAHSDGCRSRAVATPRVLLVTLRAPQLALSEAAANELRAALCRGPSNELWIVGESDLRNFFTADGSPDREWSRDDVVQFGRQLRTDIVGELAATDSAGGVRLSLVLFEPGMPSDQHTLQPVIAARLSEAAALLAARLLADSTFQAMCRRARSGRAG